MTTFTWENSSDEESPKKYLGCRNQTKGECSRAGKRNQWKEAKRAQAYKDPSIDLQPISSSNTANTNRLVLEEVSNVINMSINFDFEGVKRNGNVFETLVGREEEANALYDKVTGKTS